MIQVKDNEDKDRSLTRSEYWQRAAAIGFGLWAIMIPVGVAIIRDSIGELVKHDKEQAERLNVYILTMERRVTLIEERQARVLSTLSDHDRRLEVLTDRTMPQNGNGNGRR